jgi:hypothetical protein
MRTKLTDTMARPTSVQAAATPEAREREGSKE